MLVINKFKDICSTGLLKQIHLQNLNKCKPERSYTHLNSVRFYFFVGDGNWRQADARIALLTEVVEMNALAQGTLRQFTQWLWIEPTFQLRGGHYH